jgi:hypothetical protein
MARNHTPTFSLSGPLYFPQFVFEWEASLRIEFGELRDKNAGNALTWYRDTSRYASAKECFQWKHALT